MDELMVFDKIWENKMRWGHVWGVCYNGRYHVCQHAAELAVCYFVYKMLFISATMSQG